MELTERIAQLLEEKYATEETLADCFTVDIELHTGNKLYVFVDSDSGIDFDKCKKLSRHLESHLDVNVWAGTKYVLEVSSPGLGRPLRFLRQYHKNVGRTVVVTLLDDTRERGTLKSANETAVLIQQTVVEKEGKKKKEVLVERAIPFDQIKSTVVKAAF
ncbi:MAG: ribosome maturation factor RimP [Saprospiraceae bacterium]